MKKRNIHTSLRNISTFIILLLLVLNANAQRHRVIDNKGTIKHIGNNRVFVTETNRTSPTDNDTYAEGDIWYKLNNSKIGPIKVYKTTKDNSGNITGKWLKIAYKGKKGSVFFGDDQGYPTENNQQIYWNNTNNRLGVGTNNPTQKLDINGQARVRTITDGNLNTEGTKVLVAGTDGVIKKADFTGGIFAHGKVDGNAGKKGGFNFTSKKLDNGEVVITFENPIIDNGEDAVHYTVVASAYLDGWPRYDVTAITYQHAKTGFRVALHGGNPRGYGFMFTVFKNP